ncbi:uncharacterized protein LOC133850622 [Drosophila sulfurigaster albostrigata]|uniref:uncharacterized protein LOC133850622 n=1 Tax=Drosophila sulfurigaster albostrigata TaxID=89887 RepID=UPI002D21AF34|nr:uncharacterized protein LOC133850622 [Drosophila sulfurigaster albostrigata]
MATYTCTQFVDFIEPSCFGTTTTTFTLDAGRFVKRDLHLFMESIETISRIERERHERRQQRRERKVQQARIAELESDRCVSPTPSAEEAVDEPLMYMEAKCIPYAISDALPVDRKTPSEYDICDDEAYGSSSNQSPRSSVTYCSCAGVSSTGLDSDSAESGVYAGSPLPPVRPRSQVISKPKNRTTRSRIISMVLKREYAKAPSTDELEKPERCNHLLESTMKQKYDQLTSKSRRGIACGQGSPEECFLDRALRYLTL